MSHTLRCTSLGATIFLALFPLTFAWENGRLAFLMLRDQPGVAVASWALAAVALTIYLRPQVR